MSSRLAHQHVKASFSVQCGTQRDGATLFGCMQAAEVVAAMDQIRHRMAPARFRNTGYLQIRHGRNYLRLSKQAWTHVIPRTNWCTMSLPCRAKAHTANPARPAPVTKVGVIIGAVRRL